MKSVTPTAIHSSDNQHNVDVTTNVNYTQRNNNATSAGLRHSGSEVITTTRPPPNSARQEAEVASTVPTTPV